MAYGDLKVNNLIYDTGSGDATRTVLSIPQLASPTFTGTPAAPTAAANTNTTQIATTAFVMTELGDYLLTATAASTYAPLASPSFTGDVTLTGAAANIIFDASDNALEFADNAKATFGASGDLAIYHTGSHSKIEDTGTGKLWLLGSAVLFSNAAGDESLAEFTEDAGCTLRFNNGVKISTTNTGCDITGTAVTDGLTVAGASDFTGQLKEAVTVNNGKLSDNTNLDIENGNVFMFLTAESTTSTPNLRYNASTTLDSKMAVGDCCLLYTSPSPRDRTRSRMPSSA